MGRATAAEVTARVGGKVPNEFSGASVDVLRLRLEPRHPRRRLLVELRGDAIPNPDAYVFGDYFGRAFAPTSVKRRAVADWDAAELAPITLHECRHSCISTWIAAGVNPKTVSEYAGHASIVVTFDRYGHLLPNADDEALERIAAYLEGSGP